MFAVEEIVKVPIPLRELDQLKASIG
jgi:hypothetical protein